MDRYPLIGKLALAKKLLSKEDLDTALSKCSGEGKGFEEELVRYLISTKLISSKNIEKLLDEAKAFKASERKNKFGDIAMKKGFVSRTNLQFILEEQENDIVNNRKPGFIGDMLIEAGMMNSKQRDLILEIQKESDKDEEKLTDEKDSNQLNEPMLMEPVEVSHGLQLQISSDFLAAFLKKTDNFKTSCTVNDIKDILMDKEIIFDIVTDEMIVNFLKSPVFKEKLFRIAKGVPSVHGEDAKIAYFFNTEHLKAGGVKTDGQIDFKDRGEIPQVDQGMVLAEKTPMVEAFSGKNIYGETIVAKPANDLQLKTGIGVALSSSGLQVTASVKGYPNITNAGEISVKQEYIINGDVDYETGHIDYEGNINIKGCIKSGFKVKGDNIKAFEVEGGIVEAGGDLGVQNGINSGEINVQGNLSAKFIHKSQIRCTGEVSIGKEIIDAIIENRAKCVVTGKIISSDITAKMGVFAKDIGTEKGTPSIIKAGLDVFIEKELLENKIAIDNFNKVLEEMMQEQEEKREEGNGIKEDIGKYSKLGDTSKTMLQKILSKMDLLNPGGSDKDIEYPVAIKEKIDQLQNDIKQAERKLEVCSKSTVEIDKYAKEMNKKIGKQKLKIKSLEFERESLIKWIEENPGKAIVHVDGIIMAKTIIQGIHSRTVIEEEAKNVQIKEVRDTSIGAGPDTYKIEVFY
jgi:uncharacterized protein